MLRLVFNLGRFQSMIDDLKAALDTVQSTKIDRAKLAGANSEEDFMEAAFHLLVEVGSYVVVAANLLPGDTRSWNRNQAIIGGNIVRLYKTISAMLDQTNKHRREALMVFARLSFETIVNVKYLMKFATAELFDSYVRYSLRHEKKLYDTIHQRRIERGDKDFLPIEKRMLSSIKRSASKSGFDIDTVSSSHPKSWAGKNIFDRAKAVDLDVQYLAAFGGSSHNVHGNWQELLEHHLEEQEGGGFRPHLEWWNPRPQILLAIAHLTIGAIADYLNYLGVEEVHELIFSRLTDLNGRISLVDDEHEQFLISRMKSAAPVTCS